MYKLKTQVAFSLLEVLIALTLVGILASLGEPIYRDFIRHARREQAILALMKLASALEEFAQEHGGYQEATLDNLHIKSEAANNTYRLAINHISSFDYLISAKPMTHQSACGTLFLNASGEKSTSGNKEWQSCWH